MLFKLVAATTAALIAVPLLYACAAVIVLGSVFDTALRPVLDPLLGLGDALSHLYSSSSSSSGPNTDGVPTLGPSPEAVTDIPPTMLRLYQSAAPTCPHLSWTVLAAIGKIESDHARSTLPGVAAGSNPAGAQGPMQFEPATFARYAHPIPPGGAIPASPYDPVDAVTAAARMLCDNGVRDGNLPAAILAYNHSSLYLAHVLAQARRYSTPTPATHTNSSDNSTTASPTVTSPAAIAAVLYARAQIGTPYVWGGNGQPGFDCSGLTHAAYHAAGLSLPRTAQAQADAGPLLPARTPPQPGDLLFYGTSIHSITHVAIAISPTLMIDAPEAGTTVRIDPIGHPITLSRPTT